jgi:hypothetical protein
MQNDRRDRYVTYDSPMYNLHGMKNALADLQKQRLNK